MDGDIRRPRMRGLRRGRGVRTRGGRGGGPPPVVVMVEEVVDNRDIRGRGRGRPRGRPTPRQVRPGPQSIDELVIQDINELPEGHGLETAMHQKRRRLWQPSISTHVPQSQRSSPSPVRPLSPTRPASPPIIPPPLSPPVIPSPRVVPSPALFLECGHSESTASSPTLEQHFPRSQGLRDDNISHLINYGSDDDSDEGNNEDEEIVAPVMSRVIRSYFDTPMDLDEATSDNPVPDVVDDGECEPVDKTATDKPWGLFEFDWRAFPNPPIPPSSRREPFSDINVGPTAPCGDPYEIFIQIWDRQIMEHIVSETNKYAEEVASQMLDHHILHPQSRISRWVDVEVDELYVYFGMILAMGIVVKSRIEDYWSATRDIFYTPGFSAHMSIDRFLLLSKCLHFNDNENMGTLHLDYSEARLYKIQPILSHLNEKFQAMYIPSQNIALDESLLMWKGWLEFCQLIPNKAANRGIKTYEICESRTGYLWRFEIHAHKKSPNMRNSEDPLDACTPSIVLKLVQGLEHKGYTLWMDNFYQSPSLARRLKCLGFDCVGTLRTDRKFVPQALHSLTKGNMSPGQIAGLTSGDVDVMVWRDTNRVAMISTYHGQAQQMVQQSNKPILILDYNIMMGGVDKKDQMLAMYPVERKRTKVWYKKLFRRLLNISVLNSYIIHKHTSSITHRNFRVSLVKSLLSKHSTPAPIPSVAMQNKVDVTHRLAEFPMGNHQRMRRACSACRKQVRTFCVGCGKTVCMDPCFLTIHS